MIAIDTSVLIDLLGGDARADASEASLRQALASGPVVVCDVVSRDVAAWGRGELFACERPASLPPTDARGAVRAAICARTARLRARAPPDRSHVPDFLIGAHALLQCNALITRDAGFFRDYFKGLKIIVPAAA